MKGNVDKSRGIVTHIVESLAKIKPTDPLRLSKQTVWRKRNYSETSVNSPVKTISSRWRCKKIKNKVIVGMNGVHDNSHEDHRIRQILVKLVVMEYFLVMEYFRIFQNVIRLRITIGGHWVCEFSVGVLSCTSITVMGHRDSWHPESMDEEDDGCLLHVTRQRNPWSPRLRVPSHLQLGRLCDFNPVTNPA